MDPFLEMRTHSFLLGWLEAAGYQAGHLFSERQVLWDVEAKSFGHKSGFRPVSLSGQFCFIMISSAAANIGVPVGLA